MAANRPGLREIEDVIHAALPGDLWCFPIQGNVPPPTDRDRCNHRLAHESSNFKNTMETVSGIFASLFPLKEIIKREEGKSMNPFAFFATTKAYPSQQHLTLHLTKCKEKVVMFAQFNAVLRVNRFLRLFTL